MIKQLIISISFLLFTGCESIFGPDITCIEGVCGEDNLQLDMSYELDSNGYYHVIYEDIPDGDYGTDKYGTVMAFTSPITRVYWSSPDNYTIYHMGQEIVEPIIQYSTYTDGDGYTQQNFWIDSDSIGDTLNIFGKIEWIVQTCEWYDGVEDCNYHMSEMIKQINLIIN